MDETGTHFEVDEDKLARSMNRLAVAVEHLSFILDRPVDRLNEQPEERMLEHFFNDMGVCVRCGLNKEEVKLSGLGCEDEDTPEQTEEWEEVVDKLVENIVYWWGHYKSDYESKSNPVESEEEFEEKTRAWVKADIKQLLDERERKVREEVFTKAELEFLVELISSDFEDLNSRGYMPWEYEQNLLNRLRKILDKLKQEEE